MKLTIITPDETLYTGEVKSVKLQGVQGKFEIMNNHAPIVSALDKGEIKITDVEDAQLSFPINSGILEMSDNNIQILAQ